jgi:hypothetical protein
LPTATSTATTSTLLATSVTGTTQAGDGNITTSHGQRERRLVTPATSRFGPTRRQRMGAQD